ncbi:MAG: class I SAM-dependent methyltransferase [Thermodesulfobacteriota bacterium]|nr:class I SAM-dependent methyltransferase [Thermodesulfobacteriota bacterium]
MQYGKNRVCPVERAGRLDNTFRRWLQNPWKILSPYIKEGMTVLDFGCGPGYFTVDMAKMIGKSGRVIACDLQEEMLQKVRHKVHETELEERVTLRRCKGNKIGLSERVDFALAFYVLHEIPNQGAFFEELESILRPNGQVLVVEPPFHVSKSAFLKTIKAAQEAGFKPDEGPRVFLSKTVVFKKGDHLVARR